MSGSLTSILIPYIGDKAVAEVSVKDVRRVLKYLDKTPIMRDRTLACARSAWNWHDPNTLNPWTAEKIPVRAPRDRVLSVAELRDLLKRLNTETGEGRDIVALILRTGVRREEAAGARREEFDDNNWRVPESRMKSGAPHTVLLSMQAKKLVDRILASHNSEWLFPSPRTSGPLDRGHGYKWLKSAGVSYHLHDLRRSMSTWLGEQLVHDAVIDRILAHRRTGINRHYIHAKLTTPARKAWQSWCDHLDSMRKENVERIGRQV